LNNKTNIQGHYNRVAQGITRNDNNINQGTQQNHSGSGVAWFKDGFLAGGWVNLSDKAEHIPVGFCNSGQNVFSFGYSTFQ
jgi:hypothetical protein